MAVKIVAVRAQIKGDDMILTTIGESLRGTRIRLKSEVVTGVKGDKAAYEAKLVAAINKLAPRQGSVSE